MSQTLTLNSDKEKWYPNSIDGLESHLSFLIKENAYFTSSQSKGIRKNIAYSLQYIEFLYRIFKDINLSSVLYTQNIKSFVVHGAAVIEAICNFLVISHGFGNKTYWKSTAKNETNEYKINSITYKNKTEIYQKSETAITEQMTFDQLAKKVEAKKLFGESFPIYSKIKLLRQLRNKIHIHDSEHSSDTDWYNFNNTEYNLVKEVLLEILTSDIFSQSSYIEKFNYLKDS
mgnify:CR=1 FL=1